uniref:Uncharacterized protein n=1 Tax=Gossypium raimondii TaxID=29730 RepID=A0A0D2SGZ5_GOSRA|nr:hypothetical protein B456_009G416500 [Gossypium raimondii]
MIFPWHIAVNTLSNSSPGKVTFCPVSNLVPSSSLTNLYNGYDLQSLILFGIDAFPFSTLALEFSTSLGKTAFNSSSKAAIFWKIKALGFFSISPSVIACSTRTCLTFCING